MRLTDGITLKAIIPINTTSGITSIAANPFNKSIKTIEINDTNPIRYEYDSFSYLLHENKKV